MTWYKSSMDIVTSLHQVSMESSIQLTLYHQTLKTILYNRSDLLANHQTAMNLFNSHIAISTPLLVCILKIDKEIRY